MSFAVKTVEKRSGIGLDRNDEVPMSNDSGFYAAVSGAIAQERRMELLTNNLANINTPGYKKDTLSFRSQLTAAEKSQGLPGLVAVSKFRTDFSQGGIRYSGNPLDLAIDGKGFFEIITENGVRYTRQGNFSLNSLNQLVTQSGDRVSGSGGPLVLDGSQITISKDGEVTVDGILAGKIKIVNFADLSKLQKVGDGMFRNAGGSGNLTGDVSSSIQQKAIELSNVNLVQEMVRMIELSRMYESYQKSIQSMDEVTRRLDEVLRV